jgi:hypothetical protein
VPVRLGMGFCFCYRLQLLITRTLQTRMLRMRDKTLGGIVPGVLALYCMDCLAGVL